MLMVEHLSSAFPVKPFGGRLRVTEPDCRIFACQRCHGEVVICRRCDRGNRYCPACAPRARAEKQRVAGALYQKTEAGRLNHKMRQEQYRAKLAAVEKVTHHGDLERGFGPHWTIAALGSGQESQEERREPSPERPALSPPAPRCCDFCGRRCGCALRTAPVARPAPIHRRGPRLAGQAGLQQRR